MSDEEEFYEGVPETPEERALREWWANQWLKSVDNIEAAARHILTLCTTLIGVLLAILALAENDLPAYMDIVQVRVLGGGAVIALLASLIATLVVLMPRQYAASPDFPDKQATEFKRLRTFKSDALIISQVLFGLGLFLLTLVILVALWRA